MTFGMTLLLTVFAYLGYHHSAELALPRDIGLTSEVTVGVGLRWGLIISDRLLAAILAVILSTILYSKDVLHTFSCETLRLLQPSKGIFALILTVFAFFPLFPNRFMNPGNLFNPRQLDKSYSKLPESNLVATSSAGFWVRKWALFHS